MHVLQNRPPALIAVVTLLAIVMPSAADAGLANYRCTFKELYDLDTSGLLKPYRPGGVAQSGEFMVDRKSGSIVGDWIPNSAATSVQVVHIGDRGMSFQVVSHFAVGRAETLKIAEYIEGPEKPFVALAFAGVGVGTCR